MYHHTWAEIDLNALEYNIDQILNLVPAEQVMGVIKANAYGHGAGAVMNLLMEKGVNSFAVSNVYEAIDLRTKNKDSLILILGNVDPAAVSVLAQNNITLCIYDLDEAKRINNAAVLAGVKITCHLKLDSGMGRLGFDLRNNFDEKAFTNQIEEVFALPALDITGSFTHFATADRDGDEKGENTAAQYARFKKGREIILNIGKKYGKDQLVFHSSNSAATLLDSDIRPSDLYRAGIIMYGLTPSVGLKLPFEPKAVMSFKATVAQVKNIKKGHTISYGCTFKAKQDMKVATVTVGYADGYMRNLSNKGYMLINGKKAYILGRVCMDQTVVDVTDIEVKSGDTAVLFGGDLPIEVLAKELSTINYELVCAVAHRVPRVYIKNNSIVDEVRYHSI